MLSICLTNFNREQLLYDSISKVITDEHVTEVIISDDCSDYDLYKRVVEHFKPAWNKPYYEKVKISRTDTNIDCFRNKRRSVSLATNPWVLILDSDNQIDKEFLYAAINHIEKGFDCILQPSWAKPHFDFRQFEGQTFEKTNIKDYLSNTTFTTMLNAMNYVVKRDDYLAVWDGSIDPVTSDSIWQNYCWLKSGREIYVVPGMSYTHLVHKGSHYQNNVRRTPKGFHESVIKKLTELK